VMKSGMCLREIINVTKEILYEEDQHHYSLFVDEGELNRVYDVLEKMRDDIYDEKKSGGLEDLSRG